MPSSMMPNLSAPEDSAQTGSLGAIYEAKGNTYKYCKASAAIDAYSVALVDKDNNAAEMDSTTAATQPGEVVIPQFSVASGQYFWGLCGPFKAVSWDGSTANKVLSKIASALVKMYTTATAGSTDDASGGGAIQIQGLTLYAAQTVDDTATQCFATKRLTVNS